MKHLLNLITLVACFCIAPNTSSAQDPEHVIVEARQDSINICAASAIAPNGTYVDTLGQRFRHLSDGIIYSISLSVFDYYSIEDRPGTLAIIEGTDINGPVVHEVAITIPGVSRYLSSGVVNGITSASQMGTISANVCSISDTVLFDQVKSEYAIQHYLPSGDYIIVVTVDTADLNEYPDGSTRPPYLVCHVNCSSDFMCPGDANPNPYALGGLIRGGGAHLGGMPFYEEVDLDMAFEVKVFQDLSTGISPREIKLDIIIQGGCVVLDEKFSNSTITITDVLGRVLSKTQVFGTGVIQIPQNQVVLVTVEKDGRIKTTKVITVG